MKAKRPQTVLEYAVLRGGWRAAQKALLFSVSWSIAESSLGRELESIEEYGEWWKQSRATSYREQMAFRKAFPFDSPRELFDALDYHPANISKELAAAQLAGRGVTFS